MESGAAVADSSRWARARELAVNWAGTSVASSGLTIPFHVLSAAEMMRAVSEALAPSSAKTDAGALIKSSAPLPPPPRSVSARPPPPPPPSRAGCRPAPPPPGQPPAVGAPAPGATFGIQASGSVAIISGADALHFTVSLSPVHDASIRAAATASAAAAAARSSAAAAAAVAAEREMSLLIADLGARSAKEEVLASLRTAVSAVDESTLVFALRAADCLVAAANSATADDVEVQSAITAARSLLEQLVASRAFLEVALATLSLDSLRAGLRLAASCGFGECVGQPGAELIRTATAMASYVAETEARASAALNALDVSAMEAAYAACFQPEFRYGDPGMAGEPLALALRAAIDANKAGLDLLVAARDAVGEGVAGLLRNALHTVSVAGYGLVPGSPGKICFLCTS